MSDRSTYNMPLRDAVDMANEILDAPAGRGRLLHTTMCVRDIARAAYSLGYKAAQADANAAAQQSKSKPSPFAMQEIAPGIFAMTLENPEQLFQLLDDIEHYQRTGEIPFDADRANAIAAIKGEGPYFI